MGKDDELRIEERRAKVAKYLLSGMAYREMAKLLGCALGTIANDVKVILQNLHEEQSRKVEGWQSLEVQRLNQLHNAIWDDALAGNMQAIDRVIRISERRSKILGLDAPAKTESDVKHSGDVNITKGSLDERMAQYSTLIANSSGTIRPDEGDRDRESLYPPRSDNQAG